MNPMLRPVLSALLVLAASTLAAADVAPTNDLPNPYQTIAPWGHLPEGTTWGAFNSVAIDNDGESIWVATRCGANPEIPPGGSPFMYDTCAGSKVAPVMHLDASGNVLKTFGAEMFVFPHKVYVDPDGNVWVVDARSANERERKKTPNEKPKGHTVVKFSRQGKVLLTIGTPGTAGNPPEALTEPTSIVVAPNGDIFIAEGHSGQAADSPPGTVARISRFAKDGRFVRSFGKLGSGPAEFRTPHDITLDPQGRLWVADRGNMRIQILDQNGTFVDEWMQFSRPSGIAIRNGRVYVTDSESNGFPDAMHPGWKRGVRIGKLTDGVVQYLIPDTLDLKPTSAAEGLAVDNHGNIYGAEVGPRQLVKHVKSR
jgi:DNA-binding beta-propeller fold protein YncE